MNLQQSSEEIITQLIRLIETMKDSQYKSPVKVLSHGSIGAHIRHIIEFYDCLISGHETGMVDYDSRLRNHILEKDRLLSIQKLIGINQHINLIKCNGPLRISMNLSKNGSPVIVDTTFYRELAYNIEHAIHHMAILRIALQTAYPMLMLEEGFGIAFSTLRYQKQACAQ